jgi:hypothetical protein
MSRLRMSPKAILRQARHFLETWESMRREKEFAGVSIEEFRELLRPALEARFGLAQLSCSRHSLLLRRNFADRLLLQTMKRITSAVIGDAEEGDDGEFYGALGFVRRSERKPSIRRRAPTKKNAGRTRARARLRVRVRAPASRSIQVKEHDND